MRDAAGISSSTLTIPRQARSDPGLSTVPDRCAAPSRLRCRRGKGDRRTDREVAHRDVGVPQPEVPP
jgi:hypothetical protein